MPAAAPSKASGAAACVAHNTHVYATSSVEYYSSDNVNTALAVEPARLRHAGAAHRHEAIVAPSDNRSQAPTKKRRRRKATLAISVSHPAYSDQRNTSSHLAKPFAAAKRLVS